MDEKDRFFIISDCDIISIVLHGGRSQADKIIKKEDEKWQL